MLGAGVAATPAVAVAGAVACDVSWANTAVSGSWSDTTKWNPAVLPDSTKTACLPAGTYTVTIPADDAAVSTWAAQALDIQSGAKLTIQSDESNTSGLNTTILTVTNDITVDAGTIQIGTGAGIHGTTTLVSTSGTLHVNGTALVVGQVTSSGVGNQLAANIDIGTHGAVLGQLSLAFTKLNPTITNSGVWGTPTQGQTISGASFTTSGTIVGQGELALVGGTFDHAAGQVAPQVPVRLVGVTSFKPRSTGGGTFVVSELGNVLASDIAANETVTVEGGLNTHDGELTSSASRVNNGTLILRSFRDTNQGRISFSSGTLVNNGTLQIDRGPTSLPLPAAIEAPLINTGSLNVFWAVAFDQAAATVTQSGGTSTINNDFNMSGSGATFTVNGGTLEGNGSITGNVTVNGGTVNPGLSPGWLTIDGNYTQGAGATLETEIGGTIPSSGADRLTVTGTATLGGTLSLLLVDPYVPTTSFAYDPLVATTRSGTFASTTGLAIPGNKSFVVSYTSTTVHLTVISTGPQRKPDGKISLGSSTGPFSGDNIYNLDGTNQSKSKNVNAGKTVTFFVKLQNDGGAKDRIKVHAAGSAVTGLVFKCFRGTTDVTTAVNNGTFLTAKLAVGAQATLKCTVKVNSTAGHGSTLTRLITLTSNNDSSAQDAVKLTAGRT